MWRQFLNFDFLRFHLDKSLIFVFLHRQKKLFIVPAVIGQFCFTY